MVKKTFKPKNQTNEVKMGNYYITKKKNTNFRTCQLDFKNLFSTNEKTMFIPIKFVI